MVAVDFVRKPTMKLPSLPPLGLGSSTQSVHPSRGIVRVQEVPAPFISPTA